MKVIFRWIQNRHHEPVFLSEYSLENMPFAGFKCQDNPSENLDFWCDFTFQKFVSPYYVKQLLLRAAL